VDFGFRCLKGKVYGDWLVTGPHKQYHLKGNKMYNNKEGFFLVKDGIVYCFVPYKDVLEKLGMDMRPE